MRTETDFIGKKEIPADALFGINSVRARENFPDDTLFHKEWYMAVGLVKAACYQTLNQYKIALQDKYKEKLLEMNLPSDEVISALFDSAMEISGGKHFGQFIVPAVSGGAGTSINMNINEIIANLALLKLNKNPGDYSVIDPVESANIYQSTNDVIPTSLKVAIMFLLEELEKNINSMRTMVESLEKDNRNQLRIGYTQMQEAVPTSFGKLFSTYNEALSRDWWRVSKCFERIKVVNLGGSAIGTGIAVPRYFIMEVVSNLQKLTKLPLTRSENLPDATNNLDTFVEVHAILKAHAVNLEKMVSDLRLLASDLVYNKEISIPRKQLGSSIMPGKVNPVIPEFVISTAHKIYANDMLVSSLCAQGCLELNAYLPVIGHALLESLKLLIAANKSIRDNLFAGMIIHADIALARLMKSAAITTVLVPHIGYNKASLLAKEMKEKNLDIFEANINVHVIKEGKLRQLLKPENLLKTGFTIDDILPGSE